VSQRRIVVTGLGLLSPVGNTVAAGWDSICNGRSGIGPVTEFDVSQLNTRIAGEIRDFEVTDFIPGKEVRRYDKFMHYGLAASQEAMSEAGLLEDNNGIVLYRDRGARRVSPFYIPGSIVNMIGGTLSIWYGYKGPNIAVVTACSTSTHNIGLAARMIKYGDADVMVAGGSEYATTPTAMAGFVTAKAMSTRNDDPAAASRPWDRDRDGFVLSNGAGIVVIEELEHAKRRGATLYAEIIGFGMSGDAHHMTAPPADGEGAARCMKIALQDAGINKDEVDYINAHGTSTPLGDRAESDSIKTTFGDHANRLCISSTKSMTGHLLGAAGGAEAIFCVLAIRAKDATSTLYPTQPARCPLTWLCPILSVLAAPTEHWSLSGCRTDPGSAGLRLPVAGP